MRMGRSSRRIPTEMQRASLHMVQQGLRPVRLKNVCVTSMPVRGLVCTCMFVVCNVSRAIVILWLVLSVNLFNHLESITDLGGECCMRIYSLLWSKDQCMEGLLIRLLYSNICKAVDVSTLGRSGFPSAVKASLEVCLTQCLIIETNILSMVACNIVRLCMTLICTP